MATFTSRLGLRKPATGDNVNVTTDLNDNNDKVDLHIGDYVCTSSTRPTGVNLFTGRTIFETDTKQWLMWDGSSWLYRGGALQGTWSFAVTGATSGTGSVGNGTVSANYFRSGDWVDFWVRFTLGSTTSFAPTVGSLAFNLPIATTMAGTTPIGSGLISDSSSGDRFVVAVLVETSTTVTLPLTRASSAITSDSVPWSWATNDTIRYSGRYKVT